MKHYDVDTVVLKLLSLNHHMYDFYTKIIKTLEICKNFSENLVNDSGNFPRQCFQVFGFGSSSTIPNGRN